MGKQRLEGFLIFRLLIPIFTFASVSFILTFNILSLPNAVIGDSFAWTRANIIDILGPKVIRESYMGDAAVLSTFKTGFLFPLSFTLSSLNLPMTIVYPFLFYFISMLSFYALATEFLKKKLLRIIPSIIYVVNPVTPYYSASIMSAFAIVFLPLTLKFLIRTLRQIHLQPAPARLFSGNFALCSVFLALSISAHEQFLPSAGIIAVFLTLTFIAECYRRYGLTDRFGKSITVNVFTFAAIIFLINVQLLTSAVNIMSAPFATYFTARFHDFLANVKFTYSTANLITLLRFGGDASTGLKQNSWFDSSTPSNLFGYAVFIALVSSVILLMLHKKRTPFDRRFFWMNLLMFTFTLGLIIFVQYLPTNVVLAEKLFGLPLQSWENPSKLRVLLLLSGLTASLFAFQELEEYGKTRRRKIVSGALLILLTVSVVIYNSPWVVGYLGFTPLEQISESLNWGELYDRQYSDLSGIVESNYQYERGIIVPYTHKGELYVPPNFRLLQLVSEVNEKMTVMTLSSSISWSKLLSFLAVKYVIINENYDSNEALLFPKSFDGNVTRVVNEMNQDGALRFREQLGNFTLFENENALPKAYVTRYYVLYDEINTLKYAFDAVNFIDLPVFIGSEDQTGRLIVPPFVGEANYEVYALSQSNVSVSNLPLIVTSADDSRSLNLERTVTSGAVDWFSASGTLFPGDVISVPNSDNWVPARNIDELILNSTYYPLGNYGNFALNFKVGVLQRGEYSVQGPRVVIDAGNSTRYFVMFHTNGVVELGIWRSGAFASGVIVKQGFYDLKSEQDSIEVGIRKVFDEVRVIVNGGLELLFPVEPKVSEVSLGSDSSISRFTNIELATKNVTRIFAIRQLSGQPEFSVKQCDAEKTILEIQSDDSSDYAVVVQYLNTPLRVIGTGVKADPFRANIFFNGWIVNPKSSTSGTVLTIGIANSELALGLVSFSILFTWSILILGIVVLKRKKPVHLSGLLVKLRELVDFANWKRRKALA